ncbi:MAG TPA: hypothetical protein VKU00_00230 [Chthonomonadaceae bacterium]|nr:hypothetical protein [Chthonomonadaceae bacterium]
MKSGFTALRTRPRLRLALVCTTLSLIALLSAEGAYVCSSAQAIGYTPRMTTQQVSEQTMALCARFSNSAHLLHEPEFKEELFPYFPHGHGHRFIWLTTCEADGKRYYIQFNDLTGNLIGLTPVTGLITHLASSRTATPVKTPAEAASLAVSRISELRLVPPGTRIALAADPQLIAQGGAWETLWRAHPPAHARPYDVRLVLARSGGAPVVALNRRELTQYPID